jgi:hypothetical protein
MINRIYWDIDETLIHTTMRPPNQEHIVLALNDGGMYYTILRPCAKRLIEFSRELVGAARVHILTTATRDYAQEVNRLAGWGFKNDDIFAREDQASHSRNFPTAYGRYHSEIDPHIYAHKDNVLIDNLPRRENQVKIDFIGIGKTENTNYLKIDDYYGVEFSDRFDSAFEQDVKNFLINRFNDEN